MVLHKWYKISYSRPGKTTDNAFIEGLNSRLRDECLNLQYFEDARNKIGDWDTEYNYEH